LERETADNAAAEATTEAERLRKALKDAADELESSTLAHVAEHQRAQVCKIK
jgi:hypothetical protein